MFIINFSGANPNRNRQKQLPEVDYDEDQFDADADDDAPVFNWPSPDRRVPSQDRTAVDLQTGLQFSSSSDVGHSSSNDGSYRTRFVCSPCVTWDLDDSVYAKEAYNNSYNGSILN